MNKPTKSQIGWAILVVAGLLATLFFGVKYPLPAEPTAEPVLQIESRSAGVNVRTEKALEVQNYIDDKGTLDVGSDATVGGDLTVTGAINGGSFSPDTFTTADDLIANTGQFTTSLKVGATAVALLTGSNINAASLKVATTPVALLSGSAIDATSLKVAATPVALLSGSAIDTTSLKVGATPVALVSGSAIDTTSLKVAGTPVAVQVGALAGNNMICGSTTITGTGTIPHTLATPSYVQLSLAQDVTGDCARLSYTNASATVTAKCWSAAATPAAATTPAAVNWCVIGKP